MLTRCRLVLQTALVASCVAEEVYSVSRELIGLAHLREFNTSCANTTVGCKLVKGLATVPTVKAGETNFAITYHTDDVPVFLTDDGICSYSHSTGTETCLGFPTLLAGTMRHIGFNRNTSILWGVRKQPAAEAFDRPAPSPLACPSADARPPPIPDARLRRSIRGPTRARSVSSRSNSLAGAALGRSRNPSPH
jgi:hypothetical protein